MELGAAATRSPGKGTEAIACTIVVILTLIDFWKLGEKGGLIDSRNLIARDCLILQYWSLS